MRGDFALRRLAEQAPPGTSVINTGAVQMTVMKVDGLLPVVTFPREAILDKEHLAIALRVGAKTVLKMDLPCVFVGAQAKFIYGQVLDHLAKRAMENAA